MATVSTTCHSRTIRTYPEAKRLRIDAGHAVASLGCLRSDRLSEIKNRAITASANMPQAIKGFRKTAHEMPSSKAVRPAVLRCGAALRSAAFGAGGETESMGAAITARCSGRREAEKMGRSRVAVRTEKGIDHSGLPLGAGVPTAWFDRATSLGMLMSTGSRASVSLSLLEERSDAGDVAASPPATG